MVFSLHQTALYRTRNDFGAHGLCEPCACNYAATIQNQFLYSTASGASPVSIPCPTRQPWDRKIEPSRVVSLILVAALCLAVTSAVRYAADVLCFDHAPPD